MTERPLRTTWCFFLGALLLVTAASASAQPTDAVAEWQQELMQIQMQIGQWYRCARTIRALTVAVALLGVIASAIQGFRKAWCKPATVAIGLLVSGITAVNSQYYQSDSNSYRALAVEAEQLVRAVERNIDAYERAESDSDRDTSYAAITRHLDSFLDIKKKAPITLANAFSGGVVHAQSFVQGDARPSFNGVGICNSLAQAKENSWRDAIERAAQGLRSELEARSAASAAEVRALRAYVEKYGRTARTDFRFDPAAKTYRYTTEFQLGRGFTTPSALARLLKPVPSQAPQASPTTAKPRLEASINVGAAQGAAGETRRLRLVAKDPKDGDFTFDFKVALRSGVASVTLAAIEIREVGSWGSTDWEFEVVLNGTPAIVLPMQGWDDSLKPTRCRWEPRDGLSVAVGAPPGASIELRVRGFRAKDL